MNKWSSRGLTLTAVLLLAARAYTYTAGPDAGKTGAPNEETCRECHSDFAIDPADMELIVSGIPASYVPGTVYPVTVQVKKPGQKRWGFELTAKKLDNSRGGTILRTDEVNTRFANNPAITRPQYITHSLEGIGDNMFDVGPVWSFNWEAPAAGAGPITIYAAGNAANANDDSTGDYIRTVKIVSQEGAATTPCKGDVTGDKFVDVNDAIVVLRDATGLQAMTQEQRAVADANGDAQVNVGDAVKILRVAVDLDKDLPKSC